MYIIYDIFFLMMMLLLIFLECRQLVLLILIVRKFLGLMNRIKRVWRLLLVFLLKLVIGKYHQIVSILCYTFAFFFFFLLMQVIPTLKQVYAYNITCSCVNSLICDT